MCACVRACVCVCVRSFTLSDNPAEVNKQRQVPGSMGEVPPLTEEEGLPTLRTAGQVWVGVCVRACVCVEGFLIPSRRLCF